MTDTDMRLRPMFMPALMVLLGNAERRKGAPLTEREVLDVRDGAVCLMMQAEYAGTSAEKRGEERVDERAPAGREPEQAGERWRHMREPA